MKYGRAIKLVRTASGLSQSALAARLSIGPSQLSLIEANKRQPSVAVLAEASAALGVPPHLLTLLASDPGELKEDADPKYVAELARALLGVLTNARQQGLPLEATKSKKRKDST
jgi:transcriptional regulator with XRE-family HTH domain